MKGLILTKDQARRFLVAYHGLDHGATFTGREGISAYIRRVGCIQYDPLNVVGRNPELVLQARIKGFNRQILSELLYADYQLIDIWDKNMAISHVDDWPCFSRFRNRYRRWCLDHAEVVKQVQAEIERRGPLSSADFDHNQKVAWYYGPTRLARAALEGMYYAGELVIHHKQNTRKFYDLARRHIAPELLTAADPNPTEAAYLEWFVLRRIGSIGLLWNRPGDAWLGIDGFVHAKRDGAFGRLLDQGRIRPVTVQDLAHPLYLRSADEPLLMKSLEGRTDNPVAKILAPLDNLLWDRRLVRELFDFEYRWEVYKPKVERQYGYYVLPVLHGSRLVARFEPEKHRNHGPLVIKNWWWEPGVRVTQAMLAAVDVCFSRFAGYLGAGGYDRDVFRRID